MSTPGTPAAIEKWVVYSTFHAEGRHADYCTAQLRAYRELGFRTVVVDTSPVVTSEREQGWRSLATHWLRRENIGYDFGSYRAGLAYLTDGLRIDAARLALVLANDSCYGPYVPLDSFMRFFDAQPLGEQRVFGMTESLYFFRHLQSYWVYFRPEVAPLLAEFFRTAPPIVDRESAVQHGELGLSRFLLDRGCRLIVPHSSEALLERFSNLGFGRLAGVFELGLRRLLKRPRYSRNGDAACVRRYLGLYYAFNPTAAFGIHMHALGLSPFVKRQLLRDNPNADPLVTALTAMELESNDTVYRALRSTQLFRRRFGTDSADRTPTRRRAASRPTAGPHPAGETAQAAPMRPGGSADAADPRRGG